MKTMTIVEALNTPFWWFTTFTALVVGLIANALFSSLRVPVGNFLARYSKHFRDYRERLRYRHQLLVQEASEDDTKLILLSHEKLSHIVVAVAMLLFSFISALQLPDKKKIATFTTTLDTVNMYFVVAISTLSLVAFFLNALIIRNRWKLIRQAERKRDSRLRESRTQMNKTEWFDGRTQYETDRERIAAMPMNQQEALKRLDEAAKEYDRFRPFDKGR